MSLVHAYGSGSSDDDSEEEDNMPQDRPSPPTCSLKPISNSMRMVGSSGPSSASTPQCLIGEDNKNIPRSGSTLPSFFQNLPKPKHVIIPKSVDEEDQGNQSIGTGGKGLFSSLPVPKSSKHMDLGLGLFEFESNEKSAAPLKKTVKITVPSLSQFKDKDDGEPVKKKVKPASSGSGLFSLLPAPKNIIVKETKRSLVPHVLTKKPVATVTPDAKPGPVLNPAPHAIGSIQTHKPMPLINYEDSGEDSEEDCEKQDFFSLHSDKNSTIQDPFNAENNVLTDRPLSDEEPVEVADTKLTDEISNDRPLSFVSGFQPSPWANNQPHVGTSWQTTGEPSTSQEFSEVSDYISVVEDDIQLDEEALQRLCGRRAKTEQMEFINVKGDEIMPDPKEWLVKQLSQEQPKMRSHSHKKNDGPTTQQRRKHQITYLAFQAKENELDLKNQWSQNRMSRKQTQSKYGF